MLAVLRTFEMTLQYDDDAISDDLRKQDVISNLPADQMAALIQCMPLRRQPPPKSRSSIVCCTKLSSNICSGNGEQFHPVILGSPADFGVALSVVLVFFDCRLESSYAVCSPSWKMYTVDDSASRPEFIPICDARIVSSYGASLCFLCVLSLTPS